MHSAPRPLGFSLDLPHQQRMRDVIGLEIGDGTAQIMKTMVAREIIGKTLGRTKQ